MAYAMTKQGSLDNCVTYEFVCDTIADMNTIENKYRTIGSIAVVLSGESGGLEIYIADSKKSWISLSSVGADADSLTGGGLTIYICPQDEVDNGVPNVSEPDESTVYLVSNGGSSGNLYNEFIYVNNAWEKWGSADIDLSNYATKSEIPDVSGFAPKASPVFTGSISLGRKANTTVGTDSVALGTETTASGNYSFAEGSNSTASGQISHAEGYGTTSSSPCSHAEGNSSSATGTGAHAEGFQTVASGTYSHAEGNGTTASGEKSHAEGTNTAASGENSHAEGSGTTASKAQAHAEGLNSLASGMASHAEGQGGTYTKNNITYTSEAKGMSDHIEGYQCLTATGQPGNHAEGYQTRATGGASHSEGADTIASGVQAHAEGSATVASGAHSHSEGYNTTASGNYSHVEGYYATCSGYTAHAEGQYTIASGAYAHVEGRFTIASGNHSHVGGKFNIDDALSNWIANTEYKIGDKITFGTNQNYICKTAHTSGSTFSSQYWSSIDGEKNYAVIIGNGTATDSRSNAYALDWSGGGHFGGDIYVGCAADSTGGVKLARIPDPPTTDGTYNLQATVSSGTITYSWVAAPTSASGVSF